MNATEPSLAVKHHGRSAGLWAGIIGATAIWAAQQETLYALAPVLCRTQHYLIAHGLTLLFLAGTVVCGVLSWRDWRAAGGGSPDETDGGPVPRTRFLGMVGALLSGMFFLLILAQGIASFFFNGCWT